VCISVWIWLEKHVVWMVRRTYNMHYDRIFGFWMVGAYHILSLLLAVHPVFFLNCLGVTKYKCLGLR
jgi:hypothetical protein